MISLEQIRILEQKVNRAVGVVSRLQEENRFLRRTLESSQTKMLELESLVNTFKQDQKEIEKGIVGVLDKLDRLEDELCETDGSQPAPRKSTKKKSETTIVLEDGNEDGEEDKKPSATQEELDIF
ncbi:MAG: cell division protein ZapB [Spirochaetaceae bacterium]|nr:MAG: cell division protein ZapB [Spirochaetaceae bacterium]